RATAKRSSSALTSTRSRTVAASTALGVLCAVEAVESLIDAKATMRRPIEVVAWADEEGARFGVGLFGSTAAFGRLARGVGDRRDRDGISIAEALRALGEEGDPAVARRDPKEL